MATAGQMVAARVVACGTNSSALRAQGRADIIAALDDLGIWDAKVLEWRVCEQFPACGHPVEGGAKSVRVIVLKEGKK